MMTSLWGPTLFVLYTHSDCCSSSANRDDCKAVIDNYIIMLEDFLISVVCFMLFRGVGPKYMNSY